MRGPTHEEGAPALGRYRGRSLIHTGGAFELFSATRVDDGARRVVVVGRRHVDREGVRAALQQAARAHALIEHTLVPRAEYGEHLGEPCLEVQCEAIADGHEMLRLAALSGRRLSYGQGDALFTTMRIAMQAAHAVRDPETGRALCLGRLCLGNFLFARDGSISVLGFGHNVALALATGTPDGTCAVFQAQEVALGHPPTPASDYVAVLLGARSLVSFADMTALTGRVLARGVLRPENLELLQLVRYFETRWGPAATEPRPPVDEGLRASQRVREILRAPLDFEGLQEVAAALLAEHHPEPWVRGPGGAEASTLTVEGDGFWASLGDGPRVPLGLAAGRMLAALAREHARAPGRSVSVRALYEAGWPGEKVQPESGVNRVYVTLSRLRDRGFRAVLERHGEGYRLRPDMVVSLA